MLDFFPLTDSVTTQYGHGTVETRKSCKLEIITESFIPGTKISQCT